MYRKFALLVLKDRNSAVYLCLFFKVSTSHGRWVELSHHNCDPNSNNTVIMPALLGCHLPIGMMREGIELMNDFFTTDLYLLLADQLS